ncbi:MAG: apolipoprotein N-acyltransferase [Gemmataceae bacterium]|nr:apolipoprotein N-acyltransferase [Gemmataceae bacterium]
MKTMERIATMPTWHHAPVEISARRTSSFVGVLFRALLGGILLWLAFFPANQGWLAWFALVPWLSLVRSDARPRHLYAAAFLGGYLHFVLALKWMRVAHPMMAAAWLALALYCALYVPVAFALLRRLNRLSLPLALTAPIVWVSLEYLRAHFLTGFAWFFLGHTQHDWLPIIQIADLGGVYAVSLLVAAVNGLLVDLGQRAYSWRTSIGLALGVGPLVFAAWLYGRWQLTQEETQPGPRVALLQTNVPQEVRNERSSDAQREASAVEIMMRATKELTDQVRSRGETPDLIVWPETSFADDWFDVVPGTPDRDLPFWLPEAMPSRRGLVGNVARYSQAHVLLGLNTLRYGPGMSLDRFNSALLVWRDGEVRERYDKIHRVVFGEYIPARKTLPFMNVFSPYGDYDYSLSAGERMTRFRLPTPRGDYVFGVLICYEDSDPLLARRYVCEEDDGPAVDFLVNMSNDGWFKGTEEHELHLAICRFRAVEARRAVVRAVNMGISAVIDGSGRVLALPGKNWHESKNVAGVVVADVPVDRRRSRYALYGDVLAATCGLLCGLLWLGARPRPLSPPHDVIGMGG